MDPSGEARADWVAPDPGMPLPDLATGSPGATGDTRDHPRSSRKKRVGEDVAEEEGASMGRVAAGSRQATTGTDLPGSCTAGVPPAGHGSTPGGPQHTREQGKKEEKWLAGGLLAPPPPAAGAVAGRQRRPSSSRAGVGLAVGSVAPPVASRETTRRGTGYAENQQLQLCSQVKREVVANASSQRNNFPERFPSSLAREISVLNYSLRQRMRRWLFTFALTLLDTFGTTC
ncbi:unnamed protein product [Urochloa humidicola]